MNFVNDKYEEFIMLRNVVIIGLFFLFSDAYSVEVGDNVTFLNKEVLTNGAYYTTKLYIEIIDYDPISKRFLKNKVVTTPSGFTRSYQEWILINDLPSRKQIDALLKGCEDLGWEKVDVFLRTGINDEVKIKKACKADKELFPLLPVGTVNMFYYGHFPIYGLVRAENLEEGESFYQENLILE